MFLKKMNSLAKIFESKYIRINMEEDKYTNKYLNIEEKLKFAGLLLLSYEILKNLIIKPIKSFYENTKFSDNSPFVSYEVDVLSRHKSEFKACLLYLKDFMEAINSDDINIILELRDKRNIVAHELPKIIENFDFTEFKTIALKTKDVIFKISNYRVKMELGADPNFQKFMNIHHLNWDEVVGEEYILFEKALEKIEKYKFK